MSESLLVGYQHIRWAPRDAGGLYATSAGIDAQIAAKALGPPPLEQNWAIVRADGGGRDEYFIILALITGRRAGWGLVEGENPVHAPVLLTNRVARWTITPVDRQNGIYQITDPSGVTPRAVAEENNRLFVKTYGAGADLPRWQITPSN